MTIDVDQVGRYFVQLYYETLNKDPKEIGRYYLLEKSIAIRNYENGQQNSYHGREDITKNIAGHLTPTQTRTEISVITCVEVPSSATIIVHLVGYISLGIAEAEKFTQVFTLINDGSNRYACALDIMTFLSQPEEIDSMDNDFEIIEASDANPTDYHVVEETQAQVNEPKEVLTETTEGVFPKDDHQSEVEQAASNIIQELPIEIEGKARVITEEETATIEMQAEPEHTVDSIAPPVEEPITHQLAPVSARPTSFAAAAAKTPRSLHHYQQQQSLAKPRVVVEQQQQVQQNTTPQDPTAAPQQQQHQQPSQRQKGKESERGPRRQNDARGGRGRGDSDRGAGNNRKGARTGRGHRDDKDFNSRSLFLKSIPQDANDDVVRQAFSEYGTVRSVDLFRPTKNTSEYQCGVIEFAEAASADRCLTPQNRERFVISGVTLILDRRRERRSDRGGNRRDNTSRTASQPNANKL